MDAPYRAVLVDLRSDQAIDVLPLQDIEYDDYIGKTGSLTATIPVPNRRMAARVQQIQEGRTAVYLERGDEVCWGGIVWTMTPTVDEQGVTTVPIQAATFDSYAAHRYLRSDLTFTNQDELDIVRALWQYMQLSPGGGIGVGYDPRTSGVLRTVSYRDGDEVLVAEAINQLAGLEPGFEYRVVVYRDPATGRRARLLQLGAPKIRVGSEVLMLDLPGQILSYAFPRDATRGGTTARARGGTPNGADRPVISAEQVAQDLIDGGYPRLDTSSDHSDLTTRSILDGLARAELQSLRGPVVIPSVRIRLDATGTPALLGMSVRLRIRDVWFHDGLDARYRVIGVKVSTPQRGRAETADLYLEAD